MAAPTRLLNRNFVLLWQGQFVSQLGNQFHAIALMFWIKHLTGSASLMGTVMMVANLPAALLGPVGGTFADRFSRRKTIVLCDILRGICILSFVALLYVAGERKQLLIGYLLFITILVSTLGAFFRPAISAAIPDLVPREKISAANSLNQSSFQIAGFLGQGIGGVLYRLLGAPLLFLINGLTYIFSGISELFIEIPQVLPERARGWGDLWLRFKQETAEGFRFVWSYKGMRNMFVVAAFVNFILAPFSVLLPFYVEDHLGCRPDWFGYILATFGLGSLLGYLLVGAVKISATARGFMMIVCMVLLGVFLAGLALVVNRWAALILFLAFGMSAGIVNINTMTILQLTTPSQIRGRVFGLLGTIAAGLSPISMGLAGVIADMTGQNIPLIYLVSGLLAVFLTLAVTTDRHFRAFVSFDSAPPSDVPPSGSPPRR